MWVGVGVWHMWLSGVSVGVGVRHVWLSARVFAITVLFSEFASTVLFSERHWVPQQPATHEYLFQYFHELSQHIMGS